VWKRKKRGGTPDVIRSVWKCKEKDYEKKKYREGRGSQGMSLHPGFHKEELGPPPQFT